MTKIKKKKKFVVIEGLDGSGKGTQTRLLFDSLKSLGEHVMMVDFPQYGKPSAALVEMYLNGTFGESREVSPYQASIFYAVDRFAESKRMHEHLQKGGIIVSNRYTTANQMHQAGKIKNAKLRAKFLTWLDELEFNIFGIPRPDIVIFLDVPVTLSQKMVGNKESREYLRSGTHDIHERDARHLKDARSAAKSLAKKEGWVTICCTNKHGEMRDKADIAGEILRIIRP